MNSFVRSNEAASVNMLNSLMITKPVILSLISGLLLSLAFLDVDLYFLSWFAFVPLLAAIEHASPKKSFFLGLSFGLVFYPCAAYWVVDFLSLSKAYNLGQSIAWSLIFWLYCALLPAFMCAVFTVLKRRSAISEFILFPVTLVSFYAFFPMLFTVQLGESQSRFLVALQAIEFVGVYGLDLLIAVANIFVFRLIYPKRRKQNIAYFISALCVVCWFSYGVSAHDIWEKKIHSWASLKIGFIQPNETPTLDKLPIYKGYSRAFPPEMDMTGRLADAGAELVIWPEARYKAFFDRDYVQKSYQNEVSSQNVHLMFQDVEDIQNADQTTRQFNAAAMLDNKGNLSGKYRKMKRVAFGEYVPFVSAFPSVKSVVESFFGKFLNEIEKGDSQQIFKMNDLDIIPLICYETMFPEFVAQAAKASTSPGLLVGMSSNGWFGNTLQPYQHVYASVLRAVENRMPFVHVVNNGPSIVVLPSGRVMFETDYHQAGGYIVDVPVESAALAEEAETTSFYQRYPNILLNIVSIVMLLLFLVYLTPLRQLIVVKHDLK